MLLRLKQPITPAELHRVRQWTLAHRTDHPVEYQLWDAVLTLWLMGWVGWLPTLVLDLWWAPTLCLTGMLMPRLYMTWRANAHARCRVRCDWL